jgi:hypothetical protein
MGEHSKKGQSISIHCPPMYLLLNIWQKFLLFEFLASAIQGGSFMIGVKGSPKMFLKKN